MKCLWTAENQRSPQTPVACELQRLLAAEPMPVPPVDELLEELDEIRSRA